MNLFSAMGRWMTPALLCLVLVGCDLGGRSEKDEQKDPHFMSGISRMQGLDYKGAADAFKKALEVNPQSASAHFELGLLYGEKLNENVTQEDELDWHYASAVYHLENFLHLSPDSPVADRVRQRIGACKLELARTVSYTLLSSTVQSELERLHRTNATQRAQIDQFKLEFAQQAFAFSNRVAALQAECAAALNSRVAASQGNTAPAADPVPSPRLPSATSVNPPGLASGIGRPSGQTTKPVGQQPSRPPIAPAASPRSYKVQQGDTPASIARKHGVSLAALQAANPGLEPRRLRVGQTVNLPGPKN